MGRPRLTTAQAVEQFRQVHGESYDYSKVEYTYARDKVTIICPSHGEFRKAAHSHLQGSKCILCRNEKTAARLLMPQEDFKLKISGVHGDRYDYSDMVYAGTRNPIRVLCRIHGPFEQEAGHHLGGSGCPHCAKCGFDKNSAAVLYLLRSGDITKVGITNNATKVRKNRVSSKSGHSFEVFSEFLYDDGETCYRNEQIILKILRQEYSGVSGVFEGHTECFLNVDRGWLIKTLRRMQV